MLWTFGALQNLIAGGSLDPGRLKSGEVRIVYGRTLRISRLGARRGGHPGGNLRAGVHHELRHDPLDVAFSGPLRNDEPLGDLAVREPIGDEFRHFTLADTEWPLCRSPGHKCGQGQTSLASPV